MSFFTLKKRCPFCAHELTEDNKCQNPECILYVSDESADTDDMDENVEV